MAAITTRQTTGTGATVAGVPLTNAQLDQNFINLNTELADKASISNSAAASSVYTLNTATQTLTNKTLTNPVLNTATAAALKLNDGYTEEVFEILDAATVNLDPNNGSIQTWTLGNNRTPGQANWLSGQSIVLLVDDATAYAITWTSIAPVWKTNGGTAPILNTTGYTVIALWKVGTTIFGARIGDA